MPLSPLSDQQSTVAYAIDLLRAHQIRRENVFLHEQLKTCLKEVAALSDELRALKTKVVVSTKDEIKDLKASIQANSSTNQKALVLAERHELRLNGQSRQLEIVEQSCKVMESEISEVKMSSTKAEKDLHARTVLENQIQGLQVDCQNLAAVQQRHVQQVQVTFESFQTALDEKADTSAIESLEAQLEELCVRPPATKVALRSVSRVSESIQVLDSQQQDVPTETDTSPEPHNQSGNRHIARETVPDDLDLDANALTISYAGHHQHNPEQNEPLQMLPPPAALAAQLARVKTLRQRRFDDWTTYYDQGHKLMENLPSSFEETVVHNFVDGIFKAAHKKQCRQWLDSNGWTWENITAFGDSCSQIVAHNVRNAVIDTSGHVDPPRLMKPLLAATGQREEGGHGKDKEKRRKPKARRDTIKGPLRRSQRLVEKDSHHTDLQAVSSPKKSARKITKPLAARTNENKGSSTKVNNTADDLSRFTTQAQPKVAGKNHVHKPQRKEVENDTHHCRGVPNGHIAAADTQVPAAPSTRKRKSEPTEGEQTPKRSKSNNRNTRNNEIARPKLVSANQQVTKPIPESSNHESFLLTGHRPKHSALVDGGNILSKRGDAKSSAYGVQRKRDRRKQRLPLPPPPEIPITSTTDEE